MSHFLTYTPETLDRYRLSVTGWLQKALTAVDTFSDEGTGSFFRDSKQPDASKTLTTPARSYMALVSASRHSPPKQSGGKKTWVEKYALYGPNIPVSLVKRVLQNVETKRRLNNFELAKLADLATVDKFVSRFHADAQCTSKLEPINRDIIASVRNSIKVIAKDPYGEAYIDDDDPDTRHFFVTLHLLRAAHAYGIAVDRAAASVIVSAAKRYCIEQCYFASRTVQHRVDAARLAFAGVIYCQFEDEIDLDLIVSIVDALADQQRPTGNWPAIHPILRKDDPNNPWYIATHDLALCLTWLYFQPRVPEAPRIVILQMMENYFLKWIVPTFRQAEGQSVNRIFSGWSDDRATGGDMVVGWASAVVCHFLANYLDVLDDVINRRVIESLGLQAHAQRYLVESGQPASNPRFGTRNDAGSPTPVWIDLPPYAWSSKVSDGHIQARIVYNWTDPTEKNKLSLAIAREVIQPIRECSDFVVGPKSVGILDGPPGTRKTSLVKTVAYILEWPYIAVPASAFFDQGFDMMETRASEVFRRLNFLTYCVVFFDEFEEFLKERGSEGSVDLDKLNEARILQSDNRTIAAFTTSAMLPRLQELHDRRKCLVFLATNHLQKVDEAIVRPGRFDYQLLIDHPKVKRFTRDDSYFENPGLQTLTRLKLAFNPVTMKVEDTSRLNRISKAVRGALGGADVQKALKEFNDSGAIRNRYKSSTPSSAAGVAPSGISVDPDEYHVWFRLIEVAMEAAARRINAGASAAAAREAAALKLGMEIKNYSSEGRKGPAPLVD
jgi:hypothetical protein